MHDKNNTTALKQRLAAGPVAIVFTKLDGSRRSMLATTNPAHFDHTPLWTTLGPKRQAHNLVVWDIIASGWRSIRPSSIISWRD
jgi:hypothetical protein